MSTKFYAVLEALRNDINTDVIDVIMEAYSILLEEPHVDAPRGVAKQSLVNNFNKKDLLGIEKNPKKLQNIHINNLDQFDAFDLYIEQVGMKRADGKIHEPMRYIRDISLGKAVISPRDNISIKLSQTDGSQFLKWITNNRMAMLSISHYLERNADKAMELPMSFYDDAIRNNTLRYEEVKDLLPAPRNMHESI